jgi:hypothetical protein
MTARLVPFRTQAGLYVALNNMRAGDRIYYAGAGTLTIASA